MLRALHGHAGSGRDHPISCDGRDDAPWLSGVGEPELVVAQKESGSFTPDGHHALAVWPDRPCARPSTLRLLSQIRKRLLRRMFQHGVMLDAQD
jgi:hypothetical protein